MSYSLRNGDGGVGYDSGTVSLSAAGHLDIVSIDCSVAIVFSNSLLTNSGSGAKVGFKSCVSETSTDESTSLTSSTGGSSSAVKSCRDSVVGVVSDVADRLGVVIKDLRKRHKIFFSLPVGAETLGAKTRCSQLGGRALGVVFSGILEDRNLVLLAREHDKILLVGRKGNAGAHTGARLSLDGLGGDDTVLQNHISDVTFERQARSH